MHFTNANQLADAIARAAIEGVGPIQEISGADSTQYYPQLLGRTGIIYIQDHWKRSTDSDRRTGDRIDEWNGVPPPSG